MYEERTGIGIALTAVTLPNISREHSNLTPVGCREKTSILLNFAMTRCSTLLIESLHFTDARTDEGWWKVATIFIAD